MVKSSDNVKPKGSAMRHARPDYNRIQDPEGLIPEHEPVFLLRGQDKLAPAALRAYAAFAKSLDLDPVLIRLVKDQALRMENWQDREAAKLPDLPPETLS